MTIDSTDGAPPVKSDGRLADSRTSDCGHRIWNEELADPHSKRVGLYYLCWVNDDTFIGCDRMAGHLGPHSWEV